jgi:hypothetical protein|tara:strand:- start:832 stop:1572 length:741 start_codon:yes stop_codon:yes gene_type:complete
MSYKYVIWLKVFITGVKSMSTKIDELKSKMTSFARPNLFEVIVYPINTTVGSYLERFNGNCFSAQIPGMTTLTTEKDEGYRSIAYQKAYEDVSLGFYVSEDMKEIKFFQDWMKLMVNPKNNHVGYYDDYVGIIDIKTLSRSGTQEKGNNVTMTTTLHDAYPKSLSVVGLDYGANDEVIKIDVTFTYRTYTQTFGERQESIGESFKNLAAVHKNEDNEHFRKRMGLKVPKEFEYKQPPSNETFFLDA